MPRRRSLDDEYDAWPKYIANAIGADRDWMEHGKCKAAKGMKARRAWTCYPNDTIKIGRTTYTGDQLIEYALLSCLSCPVQWQCARFALDTWENWGTWAVDIAGLRWLQKRENWREFLDDAELLEVPVQVAVNVARTEEKRQRRAEREARKRAEEMAAKHVDLPVAI